jgi:DNA-binding HxlR family transcriptional regulator
MKEACENALKNGNHDKCPIREMLTRLGDKWSILIIFWLSQADGSRMRFSELKRSIDGISQRMLTTTLRNLERDGAVQRHYFPEVPPRVEYELTPLGKSLLIPVEGLLKWVEGNWPDIQQARAVFDAKQNKTG